jgi:glutamate-1-semialdehyde aminotransferase
MMYATQTAPSLWAYLIPALPGLLVGLAALLGWWWSRRKAPAEVRLITTQTEAAEADIVHKSVEAAVRTGEFTLKAMERAEAEIEHLTQRKAALETALEREMEELRQRVKEVDEAQADIFLILGERRKAEKQDEK